MVFLRAEIMDFKEGPCNACGDLRPGSDGPFFSKSVRWGDLRTAARQGCRICTVITKGFEQYWDLPPSTSDESTVVHPADGSSRSGMSSVDRLGSIAQRVGAVSAANSNARQLAAQITDDTVMQLHHDVARFTPNLHVSADLGEWEGSFAFPENKEKMLPAIVLYALPCESISFSPSSDPMALALADGH
jgi:hypothetical protein